MGIIDKIRNIKWKKGDGNVRSFVRYAVIATAICFIFLLLKRDNIIKWIEAGFQIRDQKKQIEYYEKEIERLESRGNSLTENKDSLEKFARQTYNFSAPGEDLYIVE